MGKLLALLLALLAGSAFAADGWSYKGVCYDDIHKAGSAVLADHIGVTPVVAVPTSSLYVRASALKSCSDSSYSASSVSIACTVAVYGYTSTSAAGAETYFSKVLPANATFTVTFPACAQSSSLTAADGAEVGWQLGSIWIGVAALLFIAGAVRRFA